MSEPPQIDYAAIVTIIRSEVVPQLDKLQRCVDDLTRDHVTRAEFKEMRVDLQQALASLDQKFLLREVASERYVTRDHFEAVIDEIEGAIRNHGWNLFMRIASVTAFLSSVVAMVILVITHFHP